MNDMEQTFSEKNISKHKTAGSTLYEKGNIVRVVADFYVKVKSKMNFLLRQNLCHASEDL